MKKVIIISSPKGTWELLLLQPIGVRNCALLPLPPYPNDIQGDCIFVIKLPTPEGVVGSIATFRGSALSMYAHTRVDNC